MIGGMERPRVLFLCVHNSARSQMAEGLLRSMAGDGVVVRSAGLEAGRLRAEAVTVMGELGLDIRAQRSKSVDELGASASTSWSPRVMKREKHVRSSPERSRRFTGVFPIRPGWWATKKRGSRPFVRCVTSSGCASRISRAVSSELSSSPRGTGNRPRALSRSSAAAPPRRRAARGASSRAYPPCVDRRHSRGPTPTRGVARA